MLSQVFSGFPNSTEWDFNPPATPGAIVLIWAPALSLRVFCGLSWHTGSPLTSVALRTIPLPHTFLECCSPSQELLLYSSDPGEGAVYSPLSKNQLQTMISGGLRVTLGRGTRLFLGLCCVLLPIYPLGRSFLLFKNRLLRWVQTQMSIMAGWKQRINAQKKDRKESTQHDSWGWVDWMGVICFDYFYN